jgi:hypothetical protein
MPPMQTAKRPLVFLALVAIVGVGGGVPAAQASPCTKQCRLLGQACRVPYKVAYQTQRAACSGAGKRLCIAAAKILYAAGKTLCRSVAISCRKSCKTTGLPGDSQCGDGIVAPSEDCDPPGWASCTGGAACSADCLCPTTTSTTVPPP